MAVHRRRFGIPTRDGAVLEVLVLVLLSWSILISGEVQSEYCKHEAFQAQCAADEVVLIQSAIFGHMRVGRCIKKDTHNPGCSQDVSAVLEYFCSGRRRCETDLVSVAFVKYDLCLGYDKHLQAEYTCTPVVSVNKEGCQSSDSVFAPPPPGYLANVVTEETSCGSNHHPWIVEVAPTQKVNLTLVDFGVEKNKERAAQGKLCNRYAVVREEGTHEATDICGGEQRERHVYTSHGSRIELSFFKPEDIEGNHFLIKYEVIGCPEPHYPDDMWMKVHRDHVEIGCYTSRAIWELECRGKRWRGAIGNCSAEVIKAGSSEPPPNPGKSIFGPSGNGLTAYIMVGVAVLITIVVLVVVLACRERRNTALVAYPPTYAHDKKMMGYDQDDPALPLRKPRPGTGHPHHAGGGTQTLNRFNKAHSQHHPGMEPGGDQTLPVRGQGGSHRQPGSYARFSTPGPDGMEPVSPPPYATYRPEIEHIYDKPNWNRNSTASYASDTSALYKSLTRPDDGTMSRYPYDGTLTRQQYDGTLPRQYNDGTLGRQYNDGTLGRQYNDGTMPYPQYNNGTMPRQYDDRSMPRQQYNDGTMPGPSYNDGTYPRNQQYDSSMSGSLYGGSMTQSYDGSSTRSQNYETVPLPPKQSKQYQDNSLPPPPSEMATAKELDERSLARQPDGAEKPDAAERPLPPPPDFLLHDTDA